MSNFNKKTSSLDKIIMYKYRMSKNREGAIVALSLLVFAILAIFLLNCHANTHEPAKDLNECPLKISIETSVDRSLVCEKHTRLGGVRSLCIEIFGGTISLSAKTGKESADGIWKIYIDNSCFQLSEPTGDWEPCGSNLWERYEPNRDKTTFYWGNMYVNCEACTGNTIGSQINKFSDDWDAPYIKGRETKIKVISPDGTVYKGIMPKLPRKTEYPPCAKPPCTTTEKYIWQGREWQQA